MYVFLDNMQQEVTTLSARDLRNNTEKLFKSIKKGDFSLITKNGSPSALAIPFDKKLLSLGIQRYLAISLFQGGIISLSEASKIAGITLEEFLEVAGEYKIDIVTHDESDLENDLKNIS